MGGSRGVFWGDRARAGEPKRAALELGGGLAQLVPLRVHGVLFQRGAADRRESPQPYVQRQVAALDAQPVETLLWESLKVRQPGPHCSGKTAIVGHTSQKSGEILDLGHLKCIDTWCYGDGWLTALDVETGRVWQANKKGRIRDKK